ncbi:MAG: hypothetical protein V2I33_24335 [Kangiellaceae bacterium]|jgi:hypothetical protein|nr:hypothetical protein [Kangiellaceae bacterium]
MGLYFCLLILYTVLLGCYGFVLRRGWAWVNVVNKALLVVLGVCLVETGAMWLSGGEVGKDNYALWVLKIAKVTSCVAIILLIVLSPGYNEFSQNRLYLLLSLALAFYASTLALTSYVVYSARRDTSPWLVYSSLCLYVMANVLVVT